MWSIHPILLMSFQESLLELVGGYLKVLNQALGINNILWILQ